MLVNVRLLLRTLEPIVSHAVGDERGSDQIANCQHAVIRLPLMQCMRRKNLLFIGVMEHLAILTMSQIR